MCYPRCRAANLYGLYVRGSRQVVVCPRGDRAELQALVTPHRWWRKAEARAVANLQHSAFLQELDRACTPMGAEAHTP